MALVVVVVVVDGTVAVGVADAAVVGDRKHCKATKKAFSGTAS